MKKYKRISIIEREDIMKYLAENRSLNKIAKILQRPPSTISREISSNKAEFESYRASTANKISYSKARRAQKRKLDSNKILRKIVFKCLHKKWSPEQIAKILKKHYPNDMKLFINIFILILKES